MSILNAHPRLSFCSDHWSISGGDGRCQRFSSGSNLFTPYIYTVITKDVFFFILMLPGLLNEINIIANETISHPYVTVNIGFNKKGR